LKYLLYSLIGIVLVVVVGLATVVLLVDPNTFRDEIASQVEEKTGRKLMIEGDIKLSVFPWIGLELGQVALGNAPGFGPEPFARLEGAEIRVKLLPLLSKRLEVKRIVLDGLRLSLAKDTRGRTNWQDLTRKEKPAQKKSEESPKEPALTELVIGGLTVKDGVLLWEDRQAGKSVRVEHLNINLDQFRFGEPVDLDLGFVLRLEDPALKQTVSLTTAMLVDEGLKRFEFRKLKLQSRAEGEIVPSGRLAVKLGSNIVMDLERQTLSVNDLEAQAADASLQGQLKGTSIIDQPHFSGQLKLQLNPRKTMASLDIRPPETADADVLKLAELEFNLAAGADTLSLQNLQGVLDDTHVAGQLRMSSFARPKIGFKMKIDTIDMDRYLPKPSQTPKSKTAETKKKTSKEKPLPLGRLASLHLDGSLMIESLELKHLKMEGVRIIALGNGRELTLKPEIKRFYRGNYLSTIRIGTSGRQPILHIESKLQQVALGPMLQDYLGKSPPLEGTAFMDMGLAGKGETITSIKRTLHGNMAFHVKDGSLTNVEILTLIKQGEAWWKGEPAPPSSKQIEKLRFVGLDFQASVQNGIVHTDRFLIDSRKLRVEGTGEIDLVQEQLDYSIRVLRMRHETDKSGQEIAKARKLPIIIDITGPLAQPKYMLDVAAMAQARFQKQIEKKKAKIEKKVIEKLDKKLGPGIGEALKGLLSR